MSPAVLQLKDNLNAHSQLRAPKTPLVGIASGMEVLVLRTSYKVMYRTDLAVHWTLGTGC